MHSLLGFLAIKLLPLPAWREQSSKCVANVLSPVHSFHDFIQNVQMQNVADLNSGCFDKVGIVNISPEGYRGWNCQQEEQSGYEVERTLTGYILLCSSQTVF